MKVSAYDPCNKCKHENVLPGDMPCIGCKAFDSFEPKEEKECYTGHLPVEEKSEAVDHPAHYQGKNECIDVMEAMFGVDAVIAFCKCNAFKYRFRANMKNGEEDIKKAEWYETKLIELLGEK